MKSRGFLLRAGGTMLCVATAGTTASAAPVIEEVVVTAQKRTESIQDVPISVSAFDSAALDARQIDAFTDLQFNVPNVSFTKGNFSGSNFQIRGIGTLLTATSGDSGVAMHVNDVYLQSPRLFETEYYDMEQVEILRGPQGTLFGRNSTGGAVNLKTAKPVLGETTGNLELQAGNYQHRRAKGHINLPMGEDVALRVAGIFVDRDGYSDNLVTGNDVDDREQYSVRASLRWEATDRTTVDLMASYFDEDSSRTRSQKQLCDQDPSAILGCLPTTLQTESINPNATLGTLLSSNLTFGAFGAAALAPFNVFEPVEDNNPDDFREVSALFDPQYEADETLLIGTIEHDWNDWLTSTLILGYQETFVGSRMDYNGTADPNSSVTIPTGFCATAPAACSFFGVSDGGPLWISTVPSPDTSLGGSGGEFAYDSLGSARDLSLADSEQWSTEFRLTTNLEGPWNFLLAGYYLDFETETDYVVQGAGLDYANVALGTLASLGTIDPSTTFANLGTPYFNSETDFYGLKSSAVFGEAYFDVTETVKLTFGLRYSQDEKSLRDRQLPLLGLPSITLTGADGSNTYVGPDGSLTPVSSLGEQLSAAADAGAYDGNPSTPGVNETFRDDTETFDAWTGRFVVDWAPDVAFTDETLLYASYSLGFKSGGLNPPVDASLFGSTPATFDNEEIGAWEIGTKNTLMQGRLQANLNLFYYDYGDLQIGKIVNRTSLNENTDAEIFGFEGEFVFAPTENWVFNATVATLDTELGETLTVDPRDPAQGRQDVTTVKDLSSTANCAVAWGAAGPVTTNGALIGEIVNQGGSYLPTGTDLGPFTGGALAGASFPGTPGFADTAFSSCQAIEDALAADPAFSDYEYLPSGVETNLEGNQLINAPEVTVTLGGQYTHFFGNGMSLTGRVDYYWQDEYYTTAFNRRQDLIDAWEVINAQVTLTSADERWFVRVFGQNLADEDNVTGTYATDPSSGLFINAFLVEPRLYGATLGVNL